MNVFEQIFNNMKLFSKRGRISLIGKITSCGDGGSEFKSLILPFIIVAF